MGPIQLIGLLLTILVKLPKLIGTIMAIIRLVRSMKDKDLGGDIAVLAEILQLILALIGLDKNVAKSALNDLKSNLETNGDLSKLKEEIIEKKKKCEGNFCPSDLK